MLDVQHHVGFIGASVEVHFAIVHGLSDNRFKRMDITSARELLGYQPRDDAFDLFDVNLPNQDRAR
jgi:hypothetical protein